MESPSYKASANSGSMNCDSLLRRLYCFKTKLPYCANAPGPYAHTCASAINLLVESDGSQPGRPVCLSGGEQARRDWAALNRGHDLLRGYVESWTGALHKRKVPRQTLSLVPGVGASQNRAVSESCRQACRNGRGGRLRGKCRKFDIRDDRLDGAIFVMSCSSNKLKRQGILAGKVHCLCRKEFGRVGMRYRCKNLA